MLVMRHELIETNAQESLSKADYPNVYTAIPPNGVSCPYTGLKHAHLYKLLRNGGGADDFVRVVNIKNPKARHGKTLFNVGDMLRYLDHLAAKQGTGQRRNMLCGSNEQENAGNQAATATRSR